MSKRKGLSLEEKRAKVQAIFFESQSFFQEKEIEKDAAKKGVRDGKDVLKSLTDDDLVLKDKIGLSNFFWSLPSTAGQQRRKAIAKYSAKIKEMEKKETELTKKKASSLKGREESASRTANLAKLAELRQRRNTLQIQLDKYAENDPELIEKIAAAGKVAKEAANRWIENVDAVKDWLKRQFPGQDFKGLYDQLDIPEELEYLE